MHTLFEEAASLLRASLPHGIELIIQDIPVDVAVSGKPAQLQQVILNLCTNAAHAMRGSGCIRVAAEQKDVLASTLFSHGELMPGRYVCLAVIDTGHGFNEDVARRLFEPFFTTRLAGTGLGLATVREIVREHGGAMNVQSQPGRGSRFEAWLPATTADSTKVPGPAIPPLGHGETVLVVESEREQLLWDEEMLAALGYEPVGFQHPADALAACISRSLAGSISSWSATPRKPTAVSIWRTSYTRSRRSSPCCSPPRPRSMSAFDPLVEAGISEVLRRPLSSTELAAALARCYNRNPITGS